MKLIYARVDEHVTSYACTLAKIVNEMCYRDLCRVFAELLVADDENVAKTSRPVCHTFKGNEVVLNLHV